LSSPSNAGTERHTIISIFASLASLQRDVQEDNQVYVAGASRVREIALSVPLHIYVLPLTIGLFLIGP